MAAHPFVQPPGISQDHNGITSERKAGKFLLSVAVKIFAQGGKGGTGLLASLSCQPAFYY